MISNVLTWQLLLGFLSGFLFQRGAVLFDAWMTHRRRHDHRRWWRAAYVEPRYLAALVMILTVGWSLFQAQRNADENIRSAQEQSEFARSVRDCQVQLIEAITGSRAITADNDRLSRAERELLADNQRYQAEWLARLLAPPPAIEALPIGDPGRDRYAMDITREYLALVGESNRRIAAIHEEQTGNSNARPALPEPDCPNN